MIRRLLIVAFCWLLAAPLTAQQLPAPTGAERMRAIVLDEDAEPRPREGPLKILGLEDKPDLEDHLETMAFEARRTLRETTRVDWDGTVYIVWADRPEDYEAMTGFRPEFTAAAALPAKDTVWINASSWRRSDPETQQDVLTHELAHLLLGSLSGPRRLPLWAEEGLVQHLADEWGPRKAMSIYRGHALGSVPRLSELETEFPRDPERQALAYATSYRAVTEMAHSYGDEYGNVSRLIQRLAEPDRAAALIEDLWNPERRDAWNASLIASLGSRYTTFMMLITSGTVLWLVIIALVAAAYLKKRRRRTFVARQEQEEEAWTASLTDDDVQDIYGDREERFGEIEETPWDRYLREKEETEERWM